MKKILLIGVAVMLALSVFTFTSCEWLIEEIAAAMAAPQGYVFDARTGDPVLGATVTLTGSTTKTATTSSSGYYTFSDVDYGTFELTATSADYVFTKQMVDVSGLAQYLPNIAGLTKAFDSNGDGTADETLVTGILSIVVFWDRDFQDVDAHLTFPNTGVGTAGFSADGSDFYNPLSESVDLTSNGFFPTTITDREHLYWNNDSFNTPRDIWMDIDNVGHSSQPEGGPESFTIYYPPSTILTAYSGTEAYSSSGTDDPSKLPAGNYSCIGVMEYYLDAWNADTEPASTAAATGEPDAMLASSDNSGTADPVVYVFDGEDQIARYTLPQYTDIERASIFRINMFIQEADTMIYYQILPDLRVLLDDGTTYANIRSLQTESGPMVVKARTRR